MQSLNNAGFCDMMCKYLFLGAFARLRKATICLVMTVRPSARYNSAPTARIFVKVEHSSKTVEKIQVSLKSDKNNGNFKTTRLVLLYLAHFFSEWGKFQAKFVEEIKTHILCSVTRFLLKCRLWDNVEKVLQSGAGHRWQYGAFALHAEYLRLQIHAQVVNAYCTSIATMVARTRLSVTV
jgi:hypothetical protein